MSPKQLFEVAGVDGCKGGWFVIIATGKKKHQYKIKNFFVAKTFSDLLSETDDCQLVCVDVPIGLSNGDRLRDCDVAARKILGRPRSSSIFPPPIRPCLCAKDYKQAQKISLRYCGKKLSKQSYFIMDKIYQVDNLITPALQNRVREIHPEISFWALNNQKPMQHNKKIHAGRNERMKLLTAIFPDTRIILAEARKLKQVAADDILDALVASWTAGQAALGNAKTLPENPKLDSKGLRMEILRPISYNE